MASGNTLLIFTPQQNEAPATNYATLDTRNGHLVLDFDTTTQEAAIFKGVMPQHYADTTGITVYVAASLTSAITGTLGWDVSLERVGAAVQDIDADGFATAQVITAATVPGTSGHLLVLSVAITKGANMDSVVAGDQFRIRIRRNVAVDTAAGDAELWSVEIRET